MSAAGLEVGTQKVSGTPTRRLRLSPLLWVGVALGAVFVLSVFRVVTGANAVDSSGLLIAAIGLAVPIALAGL